MTPPTLFRRCGIVLFGADPGYKVSLGAALDVKTSTIDAWAKGASRIPPGVWADIADLLQGRGFPALAAAAVEMAGHGNR